MDDEAKAWQGDDAKDEQVEQGKGIGGGLAASAMDKAGRAVARGMAGRADGV